MENPYRTKNCGELTEKNIGEMVKIAGWTNSIRLLGGLCFITIRDEFGVTQVIIPNESMIKGINKECVISVEGKVIERISKNKNMATGDIEIEAKKIELLGDCKPVLPFEVMQSEQTKEDVRLKYRFLDLRNPLVHSKIKLRSNVLHFVRNKFHDLNFTEVQTPILTASSPEGARDFIVPSRLNSGKFYALPQAPQQFKQLLMASGFNKYFQIAPCFRDEDPRADRSPGEFYQIDLEMSFSTQEEVLQVVENVVSSTFAQFSNKSISKSPFSRISYSQAMETYCSDKPDTRNPLTVCDVTDVFIATEFSIFKNKTIKAIVAPANNKPRKFFDDLTKVIVKYEGKGLAYVKVTEEGVIGSVVKNLSQQELKNLLSKTNAKIGETIFIIAEEKTKAIKLAGVLRNTLGKELELINNNLFNFVWVLDFPFFELDDENKLAFSHNPFSMPQGGLNSLEAKDPLSIVAYQYDLVLNGVELASGAVRNSNPMLMKKVFKMAGYEDDVVETKFSALYNAFQYGVPPHAGLALGFDRIIMFLTDSEVIRDVIAFPLNGMAQDLLLNAPNTVTQKQLDDVNIQIKKVIK
ncbi:MAG: aspartate--tRNA ligase [Clostridia bacterium]